MVKCLISVILTVVLLLSACAAFADTSKEAIESGVWTEDFTRENEYLNHMTFYPTDEKYLSYWQECAAPGTVEKLEYDTWFYALDAKNGDALSHTTPVTKVCYVYLPYGYDPAQKYDILYLMHGGGGDETNWFATIDNHNNAEVGQGTAVHLLDNLIANGEAKPCIVVTPTFYTLKNTRKYRSLGGEIEAFSHELADVMQAVESKYSTYAESTTREAFTASRDHRAFAGLSMGSMTTWTVAMVQNLDIFSWFGNMSAAVSADPEANAAYFMDTLIPAIENAETNGWNINMQLNFNGTTDMAFPPHAEMHQMFLEYMKDHDFLQVGRNYDFVVSDGPHSWDYWDLYLYDMMQVFFK